MSGFIAVHVGAGVHADHLWPAYKNACKSACKKAIHLLKQGCDSTTTVAAAVAILEDCPITNAGIGSNLSLQRTVECDAGIMEGSSLKFGSVGAMPHIKNPVQVARKILEAQKSGLSYNRIPPNTLVGEGATQWAKKQGFEVHADLVTQQTEAAYLKYISLLKRDEAELARVLFEGNRSTLTPNLKMGVQEYSSGHVFDPPTPCFNSVDDSVQLNTLPAKRLKASEVVAFSDDANQHKELLHVPPNPPHLLLKTEDYPTQPVHTLEVSNESELLDTVGAVCVDSKGTVSAAVSSGGIVLKHSGRIGHAAVYGAGCWAQDFRAVDKPSIGCSVTGVGEYLTKTLLARKCYKAMYRMDDCLTTLPTVLREDFVESPFLESATCAKVAGVLLLQHYPEDNRCHVAWAHNSKTMILGYGSTFSKKTTEFVSVLPYDKEPEKCIMGGVKNCK